MKKVLLLAVIVVAAISGCEKNSGISVPLCEQNNTGTLNVRSIQNEIYGCYINGGFKGYIGAGQTVTFDDITPGTYTVQCKEVDYVFIQDTYSASVTIKQCQTFQVNF